VKTDSKTVRADAATINAGTKTLLADFRAARAEKGGAKTAALWAVRGCAACLWTDSVRLSRAESTALQSMRQGVRIETKGRDGEKSVTEESVQVLAILEAIAFGGAAIRSGTLIG
jgi:hypothetical protein